MHSCTSRFRIQRFNRLRKALQTVHAYQVSQAAQQPADPGRVGSCLDPTSITIRQQVVGGNCALKPAGVVRSVPSAVNRSAACGAQMFLDSGDGIVLKGAAGDWFDSTREEYHLTEEAAKALMTMAVDAYKEKHDKKPPAELFIHGQTRLGKLPAPDSTHDFF
jgi:hypothetical protein